MTFTYTDLHPTARFLLQPHILTALFNIRIPVSEIAAATDQRVELIEAACDTWDIDVEALRSDALNRVRSTLTNKDRDDPDIHPYQHAVRKGAELLGWEGDLFIKSYKLFRSNRQPPKSKDIKRPSRARRFLKQGVCKLNLMEYFMLWSSHSKDSFLKHGKTKSKDDERSQALQVCRIDHSKPYSFDNCFIGTQADNMSEMHQREQPGKSAGQSPVVVKGVLFESRSEAKKVLGRSEGWLCASEGDYVNQIYRVDECEELLLESLSNYPANDSSIQRGFAELGESP